MLIWKSYRVPLLLAFFLFPFFFSGCATVEKPDSHVKHQMNRQLEARQAAIPPWLPPPPESVSATYLSPATEPEEPAAPPEPETTAAQEIEELQTLGSWEETTPTDILDIHEAEAERETEIIYDFPVTVNRQVEYYLDFFQNKQPEMFQRWLARSGRYVPMIQQHLKEAGLPLDLAYLAMIESGFIETAYSHAKAVGMWQFIRATGRHYGLTVNRYIDERRDPVKSTEAATAYLGNLYAEFGSWYLAVAGYNAGEGKIRHAIKRYKSTNFWVLAQGGYLKLETKRYVPKLIAAIIIARNPAKYGFSDIDYKPPLAYETIEVPRWTALSAVAIACGESVESLQNLNRELRGPFTPPDSDLHQLKLPVGKKALALRNLDRVRAVVTTNFKTHTVARADTLTSICKRYGLTKTIILKANRLRAGRLQLGQRLRIPYQTTSYELVPAGSGGSGTLVATAGDSFILHKVRPGESISYLAKLYNVPAHLIAGWNDIRDINQIKAGQQLALYVRQSADSGDSANPTARVVRAERKKTRVAGNDSVATRPERQAKGKPAGSTIASRQQINYYTVQSGDTLWSIARRLNHSVDQVRAWNHLKNDIIHPGARLRVAAIDAARSPGTPTVRETYYKVRNGDTLWTIARKHKLTPAAIRKWNHMEDDMIYPGNRLLLKLAADIDA